MRHCPPDTGEPCERCGLIYSPATAYIPCFDEGDTLETWKARYAERPDELGEEDQNMKTARIQRWIDGL